MRINILFSVQKRMKIIGACKQRMVNAAVKLTDGVNVLTVDGDLESHRSVKTLFDNALEKYGKGKITAFLFLTTRSGYTKKRKNI